MKFLSNTRLPLDNFISGALIGGMSSLVLNKDEFNTKKAKKIAKISLESGIAAAFAINASNKIAQNDFSGALTNVILGVVALNLSEKFLKED